MNPMYVQVLGTLLRYVISGVAASLVTRGILTADQTEWIVTGVIGFLSVVGWALYVRYRDRLKFMTALASSAPMTEQRVEQAVNAGEAPSSLTAKSVVPVASIPQP